MKTPADPQPRFTCRLVRGWIAVFGDTATGEPRGPGAAHVATCADCRQFFGACDELDHALRRAAAREWRDAPPALEQNILRAVRLSAPPATRGFRAAPFALAGATAGALLAAVVFLQRTPPAARRSHVVAASVDPAMLAAAREFIAAVPANLFGQMRPEAQAILQQDPLQDEVEAVKSDARTAVRFLARNFLPMPPDEPSRGE